jgi:FAD/FMN-containing dehydrogenase
MPPLAVAEPRDAEQVAAVVDWCRRDGIALTPRGAGTGMPGGNVGPGVVLDLSRMTGVEVLPGGVVRAGAGAVAADVDAELRSRGRHLPALPSSAAWCTVGGMVAADAAGARSFRYGPTHDWTSALDVVRADGSIEAVGGTSVADRRAPWAPLRDRLAALDLPPAPRVRKNASGYAVHRFVETGNPVQLLAGSEGTLAIVTSVDFRTELLPDHRAVVMVGLPDLDALPAVAERARAGSAVACEYFGRRLLELGRLLDDPRLDGLDCTAGALLVEYAGTGSDVADGVAEWTDSAWSGGVRAAEAVDEIEGLWGLRHAASPAIAHAAGHRRSIQFIEDCVVPVAALPRFVSAVEAALARGGMEGVIFGHAGDGNLHVNPLVDLTLLDWRSRVRDVLDEVTEAVSSLGGTLSGEHGDGRIRAPLLDRVWSPPLIRAFRLVKDALDPDGILNPGVVLPLPAQDALEGVAAGPDLQRIAVPAGGGAGA